jgi:hypothetical protein
MQYFYLIDYLLSTYVRATYCPRELWQAKQT